MSFNNHNPFNLQRDPIPLYPVRQTLPNEPIQDVEAATRLELQRAGLGTRIRPGQRIAITAGSRGIASIAKVVRGAVNAVRAMGAEPFLVPAMGSHGGATAEGQIGMLSTLGITEESMGAPIISSMETVQLGVCKSGMPVYLDKNAAGADGIIAINRIKQHTDYSGPIESGVMKMIAIGLGKRDQAEAIHAYGCDGLRTLIPEVARFKIEHAPILMGVGLFEDGREQLCSIRACYGPDIEASERVWLDEVRRNAVGLPFDEIDLLIVDTLGKNISGAGMDTRVIGRMLIPGQPEPDRPRIERIAALDLTDETHGNAIGVGLADIVTTRLVSRIDWTATYINSVVANSPRRANVPIVMPDERSAVDAALHLLRRKPIAAVRIVRIVSTLEVEQFRCSESLMSEVEANPKLTRTVGDTVWV